MTVRRRAGDEAGTDQNRQHNPFLQAFHRGVISSASGRRWRHPSVGQSRVDARMVQQSTFVRPVVAHGATFGAPRGRTETGAGRWDSPLARSPPRAV